MKPWTRALQLLPTSWKRKASSTWQPLRKHPPVRHVSRGTLGKVNFKCCKSGHHKSWIFTSKVVESSGGSAQALGMSFEYKDTQDFQRELSWKRQKEFQDCRAGLGKVHGSL